LIDYSAEYVEWAKAPETAHLWCSQARLCPRRPVSRFDRVGNREGAVRPYDSSCAATPVMRMPEPELLYLMLMAISTEVSASAAAELAIGPA
jgi:hypothetical protein